MSLPVKILAVALSTAVYLALAIAGWGGPAEFFSHDALIALTVAVCILAAASLFAGGSLSAGVREDRGNRWVITAFVVISVASAWLPAWTDRHEFWTFGGDAVRWIGVVLFLGGGLLRLWPVYVLGNRFSGLVAIQPGHALETGGIYSFIRHPSYLGLMINAVGWALAFRSGVGLLFAALNLVPLIARMRAEEKLLLSEFGEAYAGYRARTSRLVPGVY
jgi:protein-S-isoprenylcysteine O-methyltransferase Ste14